jgi:catechol 2,3-dioxygenase-like lactoylglutathione lyase family enzyme
MQQAKLIHAMVRVRELERSLQFYDRALGLREVHRLEFPDFTLVYLRNDALLSRTLRPLNALTWQLEPIS